MNEEKNIDSVNQCLYVLRGADVPVATQQQMPMFQKVHKTVEIPEVPFTDRIADEPVVMHEGYADRRESPENG